MARLQQSFDPRSVQPVSPDGGFNFEPGDYPAILTGNIIRVANSNQGSGLIEYTGHILDGKYKDQTFKWIFNVYNSNSQSAEIAWRQLGTLGQILQLTDMTDLDSAHNKPIIICVRARKDDPSKPPQITGCMPISAYKPEQPSAVNQTSNGFVASAPAPVQQAAPPTQAAWQPNGQGQQAPAAPAPAWSPPGAPQQPQQAAPPAGWQGGVSQPTNAAPPAAWVPPGR